MRGDKDAGRLTNQNGVENDQDKTNTLSKKVHYKTIQYKTFHKFIIPFDKCFSSLYVFHGKSLTAARVTSLFKIDSAERL